MPWNGVRGARERAVTTSSDASLLALGMLTGSKGRCIRWRAAQSLLGMSDHLGSESPELPPRRDASSPLVHLDQSGLLNR